MRAPGAEGPRGHDARVVPAYMRGPAHVNETGAGTSGREKGDSSYLETASRRSR